MCLFLKWEGNWRGDGGDVHILFNSFCYLAVIVDLVYVSLYLLVSKLISITPN